MLTTLLGSVLAFGLASAQFPPKPEGITVLQSKFHPNVTISYKENGLCETSPGVKSYSGYVHLPPGSLSDTGTSQSYPINAFFWFFEAREADPANAPLSIWMNGGPGSSSMIGLLQENGPCFVTPDSESTVLNPWSWSLHANMLYFDQPVQTGFSYDTAANGTLEVGLSSSSVDYSDDLTLENIPYNNWTSIAGTFPSGEASNSANTTTTAAHAAWHFAQTFFGEFPEYSPNDNRISIWTESYGGRYGPAFAAYFEHQNELITNGTITEAGAIELHLDTLGIINGCIDLLIQEESYPKMAYNNTYGIQVITQQQYESSLSNFTKPGGAKDLITACYEATAKLKNGDEGDNAKVNKICKDASDYVNSYVEGVFFEAEVERGYYDIAHPAADPFPPEYYVGWLAKAEVQKALGVPINFTESISSVSDGFTATGDYAVGGFLEDMAYVLSRGVKIAMVYGDRDYACNWYGGEAVSLALNYTNSAEFRAAGYQDLIVNETYVGGLTRQHGNFSFTRVFQSGHEVPAYQPETAYVIFNRSLSNLDISTGKIDILVNTTYSTTGQMDIHEVKDVIPEYPAPTCYVLEPYTCSEEQWDQVVGGALVKNYILQDKAGLSVGGGSSSTVPPNSTITILPTPRPSSSANTLLVGTLTGLSMTVLAIICM